MKCTLVLASGVATSVEGVAEKDSVISCSLSETFKVLKFNFECPSGEKVMQTPFQGCFVGSVETDGPAFKAGVQVEPFF